MANKLIQLKNGNDNLYPTHPDTGWKDLVLLNGVTQRSGDLYKPQYRKIGNVVYLKGQVTIPAHSQNIILGVLPIGYRPPYESKCFFIGFNNWIDTGGNIWIGDTSTEPRYYQSLETYFVIN